MRDLIVQSLHPHVLVQISNFVLGPLNEVMIGHNAIANISSVVGDGSNGRSKLLPDHWWKTAMHRIATKVIRVLLCSII